MMHQRLRTRKRAPGMDNYHAELTGRWAGEASEQAVFLFLAALEAR